MKNPINSFDSQSEFNKKRVWLWVIANLVTWVPFVIFYLWEIVGGLFSDSEEAAWTILALIGSVPYVIVTIVVMGLVNGLLSGLKNNPKKFTWFAYIIITIGVILHVVFFGYSMVETLQMRERISDNAQCKQRCQAQKYEWGNIGKDGRCYCNSYRP